MNLPPFDIFPLISDSKIRLRQIMASDMDDLLEISYYDAKQAKNVTQAIEKYGAQTYLGRYIQTK